MLSRFGGDPFGDFMPSSSLFGDFLPSGYPRGAENIGKSDQQLAEEAASADAAARFPHVHTFKHRWFASLSSSLLSWPVDLLLRFAFVAGLRLMLLRARTAMCCSLIVLAARKTK